MPHELSGGMQQERPLPSFDSSTSDTFMDEPLGKLDAMTRENIRGDLQSMARQKTNCRGHPWH